MAVVRGLLLRRVDRAFGAVDVENHAPRGEARRGILNEVRVQASKSLVVSVFGENIRFEPVERRGERQTCCTSLAHVSLEQRIQAKGLVQLTRKQQPTTQSTAQESQS